MHLRHTDEFSILESSSPATGLKLPRTPTLNLAVVSKSLWKAKKKGAIKLAKRHPNTGINGLKPAFLIKKVYFLKES